MKTSRRRFLVLSAGVSLSGILLVWSGLTRLNRRLVLSDRATELTEIEMAKRAYAVFQSYITLDDLELGIKLVSDHIPAAAFKRFSGAKSFNFKEHQIVVREQLSKGYIVMVSEWAIAPVEIDLMRHLFWKEV